MMDKLNEILQELGISKVKLAKYLGVSRQMIYNYLEMNDISRWPKDKKMKLKGSQDFIFNHRFWKYLNALLKTLQIILYRNYIR